MAMEMLKITSKVASLNSLESEKENTGIIIV